MFRLLICLRYRVRVHGLQQVRNSKKGTLILPNHVALVDPPLVYTSLWRALKPRPNADDMDMGDDKGPAGRVDQTTIGSLGLEVGRCFGYWFDFGDDWLHQIDVTAIEEKVPAGKYPKVTKKVGKSPPQYAD